MIPGAENLSPEAVDEVQDYYARAYVYKANAALFPGNRRRTLAERKGVWPKAWHVYDSERNPDFLQKSQPHRRRLT